MKASYHICLVVLLALTGCAKKEEPTVTIPLVQCHDDPMGEWQHQHRSGYTTHTKIGNSHIPHYHPSRDWDEQKYLRTCAYYWWNRETKVEP